MLINALFNFIILKFYQTITAYLKGGAFIINCLVVIFLVYKNLGPISPTRDNVMLECSKRAENIINRKVTIFYIETVLNFFSTPKNIFSDVDRKKNIFFLNL